MRTALKSWFLNSGGGSSVDNYQFLIDNFDLFIDNNSLPGAEDSSITDDVIDLTGNGYDFEDASPAAVGGAKVGKGSYFSTVVTAAKLKQTTANKNVLMSKLVTDNLFKDSTGFEAHYLVELPDNVGTLDLFGYVSTSTNGGILIQLNTTKVQILLFSGSTTPSAATAYETLVVLPPFAFKTRLFSFVIDKSNNTCRIFLDGGEVSTATKSGGYGGVSNWNPAAFNGNGLKAALGGYNVNGALTNKSDYNILMSRVGIKRGLFSDAERLQVFKGMKVFGATNYDKYARGWEAELLLVDSSQVAAKRALAINHFFNGNGFPTSGTPASITNSYSGMMHGVNSSGLTNASTVTRYAYTHIDGDGYTVTNYVYHIISDQTPVNKLHFVAQGHGYLNDIEMINACNAVGIDVAWVGMPLLNENSTTNPKITASGNTDKHKQIYSTGIDREGYTGYEMYVFDKIKFVNYCEANYSYSQISISGASGGSTASIWCPAMDPRFTKSWPVRGMSVMYSRNDPGDYELSGTISDKSICGPRNAAFFEQVTNIDLIMLALSGGRSVHYLTDILDEQAGGVASTFWQAVESKIKAVAIDVGGTYDLTVRSSDATHEYSTGDIADIMAEI